MFDVAVIGAGPSGAWTAFNLARAGAKVAIVDGSHPREKPCGGGLTGRALAIVADAVPRGSLPSVRVHTARFVETGHGVSCAVPLDQSSSSPALEVIDRRSFDALLLRAACDASATHLPARVTGIVRASRGFRLQSTAGPVAARFLVGADGANSLVRRALSAPLPRTDLSVATGYFVHGTTSQEIVIELLSDPPGYLWSFPRPDHLAVGICVQTDAAVTVAALRDRTARWIRANGLNRRGSLQPYGWPIPSLTADAVRTATLQGPDWLLVGDAAGLVDPITREGIFFALQSGEMASRAIGAADLARYGREVRSAILPELARAAQLKAGFFQPRFTALVLEALRTSPAIRQVMADLVAGTQPYRGLRRRLLCTLEARLAWRLLKARMPGSRPAPALARAAD